MFIGYTYNRHIENERSSLVSALIDLENNKMSNFRINVITSFIFIFMFANKKKIKKRHNNHQILLKTKKLVVKL